MLRYKNPSAWSLVQFNCSIVSDSLWPHGLQYARPPCPSPTPGVHWNSRPLSQWCHPTISSSVAPFSSCPQSFPVSESFPMSRSSHQVAKVLELQLQRQSFQWVFRADFLSDWLVWAPCRSSPGAAPCSPGDSQESTPAPHFDGINSSVLSLLYSPTLTSVHDYWKNHSFDYTDLCWQLMSLLFNTLWNESMEIKNSTRHLALVEQENCLIPHVLLGSIMLDA